MCTVGLRRVTGRRACGEGGGSVGVGVTRVWRVAGGVASPHDLTLTAAPLAVTGAGERALAVYIAETRSAGSSLRKFILLPDGDPLLPPPPLPIPTLPSQPPGVSRALLHRLEEKFTWRRNESMECEVSPSANASFASSACRSRDVPACIMLL